MGDPLQGGCLCGSVRYSVRDPRPVWDCHCWRCRKWTGHFMPASNCARSQLQFLSDDTLTWYRPDDDPSVAYGFCCRCGSSMFWKVVSGPLDQLERISISAGTFDQPTGLRTEKVIFAEQIGDYRELAPTVEVIKGECGEKMAVMRGVDP